MAFLITYYIAYIVIVLSTNHKKDDPKYPIYIPGDEIENVFILIQDQHYLNRSKFWKL